MKYKNIAIFASGNGTNAENIINFFYKNDNINISSIFCNSKNAFVLERAKKFNIGSVIFNKKEFINGKILEELKKKNIDFIVLAGFLWKIPTDIIDFYSNKIINIHPALLPNYGGKGMYGMNIHNLVFKNKEKKTGITIHFVNENYDEGNIIFQKEVDISNVKSANEIAIKIHQLEQEFFPKILEQEFIK